MWPFQVSRDSSYPLSGCFTASAIELVKIAPKVGCGRIDTWEGLKGWAGLRGARWVLLRCSVISPRYSEVLHRNPKRTRQRPFVGLIVPATIPNPAIYPHRRSRELGSGSSHASLDQFRLGWLLSTSYSPREQYWATRFESGLRCPRSSATRKLSETGSGKLAGS